MEGGTYLSLADIIRSKGCSFNESQWVAASIKGPVSNKEEMP